MKDEDWVNSTSVDDEAWIQMMEQGMHLNVRPYLENPSLANFDKPAVTAIAAS